MVDSFNRPIKTAKAVKTLRAFMKYIISLSEKVCQPNLLDVSVEVI